MEYYQSLDQIVREVEARTPVVIAIAQAADREVLLSVKKAYQRKIANFLLFGDQTSIVRLAEEINLSLADHQVVHTSTDEEACRQAVYAVYKGEANIVMKGLVHSSDFLRAVLNKEWGLRTGKVLSHMATFQLDGYDRLIHVTDASINISPTLEQKAQIIENAASYCQQLGNPIPKVAMLSALELVNPKMSATVDAAILSQMNRRGQLQNMLVDGPFALDNAVSIHAAKVKKIDGEVAGQADILVVPDIEAGNILYKSLVYFSKAKMGAIVLGAKAPVILTSRADSAASRVYSMALAVIQI